MDMVRGAVQQDVVAAGFRHGSSSPSAGDYRQPRRIGWNRNRPALLPSTGWIDSSVGQKVHHSEIPWYPGSCR